MSSAVHRTSSLKVRIALALALVATLVGALAAGGSYLTTARQVDRNVDELLLARAKAALVRSGRQRGGDERCPIQAQLQPAAAVQIVTSDGTVVSCLEGGITLPLGEAEEQLFTLENASVLRTIRIDGDRYRMLSLSVRDGTIVQVARDLDEAEGVLDGLRARLAVVTLAGVALAAIAGWLIARRIVRPVTELRDAAENIAVTQDLTTPLPRSGDGEVGSLATSFSTMMAALAASRAQQQRLIADASHEMRTPLTSLRTNIELLEHFERLDARDRTETLAAVQVDVGELTNLLTELVELATDRAGTDEPAEPLELQPLVEELTDRAERRSGRVIDVVVEAPPAPMSARPRMIERAISNLVDNALKYAPDGPIEVALRASGVEVRDRGPGIPDADLPHVFERFYRATAARSAPGSGLGLAIVEQIVRRHGGTCWARNRPGGGACIGFDLPVS